jgi:hypothetical protein
VLMFYLWSFSDSCGFEFSEMTYWFLLVRQISAVLWRVRVTSVAGFRQRALILGGIPPSLRSLRPRRLVSRLRRLYPVRCNEDKRGGDRSNIEGRAAFIVTFLFFVLCNLRVSEVTARQAEGQSFLPLHEFDQVYFGGAGVRLKVIIRIFQSSPARVSIADQ